MGVKVIVMCKKKAVILLSGGLDSATCLAIAQSQGFECYALSFDYGQRHRCELASARKIAAAAGVTRHIIMPMDMRQWGGSALTDDNLAVPTAEESANCIPITYVPARNLVFLAVASAWAEAIDCRDIFIGVNSVDYSGYPDCREEFIRSFEKTANLGTRAADEDWKFTIHTPLQHWNKAEIIREGCRLGVDYSLTVSCYNPDSNGRACGICPSCALRKKGFEDAGVKDVTLYQ